MSRASAPGRLALGALLAAGSVLALTACETTQDQSARLKAKATAVAQPGQVALGRPDAAVRVLGHHELRTGEKTAIVVELENRSARPLAGVPVGIEAVAGGKQQYTNLLEGTDDLLLRVPVLPPRTRIAWVNADLPPLAEGVRVTVRPGAAVRRLRTSVPRLRISGLARDPGAPTADGTLVHGTVHNDGRTEQRNVPVFVVARDGTRPVAAGTSRIDRIPAGARRPFQAYLIGDGRGGRLDAVALPTKLRSPRSSR